MPSATWCNLPADKRQRVLDAAMAEFGARGFSGGSLNVIAREAGVSKGSLFQYFDDKLDLFAHVCDACSEQIRDYMTVRMERHADLPLFDFLRATAVDFAEYFRDHPVDRGVTFATNFEIDSAARSAVRRVTNRHYVDVLRPIVKLAADRGELRTDVDHDHLLAILVLVLPHIALAPYAPELDPVLGMYGAEAGALQRPVEGFVDVLERAYAPPPETNGAAQ